MTNSRKTIGAQALRLTMIAVGTSCLGVAVVAAPMTMAPVAKLAQSSGLIEHRSAYVPNFQPLSSGPAYQLSRASAGEDEDCVRVTRMTGPDGRVYVTRGLICNH